MEMNIMTNTKIKKFIKPASALAVVLVVVTIIGAASGSSNTRSPAYNSGKMTGLTIKYALQVLVNKL